MSTATGPDLMERTLSVTPLLGGAALLAGLPGALEALPLYLTLAGALGGRLLLSLRREPPLWLDLLLGASALLVSSLPLPYAGAAAGAALFLLLRPLAIGTVRFLDV